MNEDLTLRITPRARALYARLKATTDENERTNLECALHTAVGLFPWSHTSVSEVVAYLAEADKRRG